MAKKRFRGSLGGFNKKDVNTYVQNLMDEYEAKIVAKQENINNLQKEIADLMEKNKALKEQEDQLQEEKDRVTYALVKANEMSEQIVKEAKEAAFKEVADLEIKAEEQREAIIDIKKELTHLQEQAAEILGGLKNSLEGITGSTENQE